MTLDILTEQEKGFLEKYKIGWKKHRSIIADNLVNYRLYTFRGSKLSNTHQIWMLAMKMNISPNTLRNAENGLCSFTLDSLSKISAFTGIPISVFFQKDGVAGHLELTEVVKRKRKSKTAPVVDNPVKPSSVFNRVKNVTFFNGADKPFILLPNGKCIERPCNTSVEVILNDKKKIFVDIIKIKGFNNVVFLNSQIDSDLIMPTQIKIAEHMPDELSYDRSFNSILILTVFRQHVLKLKYYETFKVYNPSP